MDSWDESVTVHSHLPSNYSDRRVDTLTKMKDALPSLEKYTSQSCAEETFAEIYHWTFTYLKENEMRKVIDLDVTSAPLFKFNGRLQLRCYKFFL